MADPVQWQNIAWLLLELFDWWSDLIFTMYLYYYCLFIYEGLSEFATLFWCAFAFICVTYLTNILYLTHYLQIWLHPKAPGVTRHWLRGWTWLLLFITMTFGGVHVSLDFCNCLFIPADMFGMHLPYSEIVRTRKDRFISNVILGNVPFIVIQWMYTSMSGSVSYCMMSSFISSVLSLLACTAFAINRRDYAQQKPIALFSISLHVRTTQWKTYFIHSHYRIQKAIADAVGLRKKTLLIVDQCSESFNSMQISARVLSDYKQGFQKPADMDECAYKIILVLFFISCAF